MKEDSRVASRVAKRWIMKLTGKFCGTHFPGGPAEARAERQRISQELGTMVDKPGFSREWVHTTCKNVNDLRNRVAHHEPLINGFPLKGRQRRMTAAEGYAEYVKLARMIDTGLGHWLQHHSDVPNILGNKP